MLDSHQFISPRDLHEKMQTHGPVLLVDVREPVEFREAHARGARSLPVASVSVRRLQQLAPDWDPASDPVYLVCQSGLRALQAAEQLHQQGAKQPCVVDGGSGAWDEAGLPMVRQQAPQLSLERQTQVALGAVLLMIVAKGVLVHPGFYLLVGLVGLGLLVAGITAKCSLSAFLARMPWNRQPEPTAFSK